MGNYVDDFYLRKTVSVWTSGQITFLSKQIMITRKTY